MFSLSAKAEVIDHIIALVDEEVILRSDFDEFKSIVLYSSQQNAARQEQKIGDNDILEDLIVRRIQLNKAKLFGIRISDDYLNQLITEDAERQNISPDQLLVHLENFPGGLTTYRTFFRDNTAIVELQRVAIRSSINITDLEARNFLSSEQGRQSSGLIYELAFVSLPNEVFADNEQKAKSLEEIDIFLSQDIEFTQLVSELNSRYPTLEGKRLEPRHIGNLPTIFSDIVPFLQKKQVSEPIVNNDKTYLVKVLNISSAHPVFEDKAEIRHILLQPSVIRNSRQTQLLLEQLRERIVNGESFELIASTYTEDLATKNTGGNLGLKPYTFFVPAFAKIAQEIPLLEISQPFLSTFGWHVLQVLERKKDDISERNEIHKIRNYLFQQKVNDELPRWLNQLRESAYVEIKDNSFSSVIEKR